jgi:hypothetical protein
VETHLRFGVGTRTESDFGLREMIMRRDHETRCCMQKNLQKLIGDNE